MNSPTRAQAAVVQHGLCDCESHPPYVTVAPRTACMLCEQVQAAGNPPIGASSDTIPAPPPPRRRDKCRDEFVSALGRLVAARTDVAVRLARPWRRSEFFWPAAVVAGWRIAVLWDDDADESGCLLREVGWVTVSVSPAGGGEWLVRAASQHGQPLVTVRACGAREAVLIVFGGIEHVRRTLPRMRTLRSV